jgi:arginyl-tRNA synthetase
MKTVQQQLQEKINAALQSQNIDTSGVTPDALRVVPTANAQFGDYQWNGALPLAKTTKQNPRVLAQTVIDNLDVGELSQAPEIAGPGFVNFRLKTEFLQEFTLRVLDDARLGVPPVENPQTIVVDFSGPNVAKPMHVGHIRSTVIGDAIQRLLRFAGHNVITDNHIGDWGTQFGKVIIGWKNHLDQESLQRDAVAEMGRLYKLVNDQAKNDAAIEEQARQETAKLQNGDEDNLAIWNTLRDLSQQQFDEVYGRLNVTFDVTLGESFYNNRLQGVVEELKLRGIARESEGAVVVFSNNNEPSKDDPSGRMKKAIGCLTRC